MYTHPRRFRPDPGRLRRAGIDPEEPFIAFRFKAWRALHDRGVRGPGVRQTAELVEGLRRWARPVISSERPLPRRLRAYANPLPSRDMLHLLGHAALCIGEGSCTAAEAACLGTPSIFASPESRRGYLDVLEEEYGLLRTVTTLQDAAEQASRWLVDPALAVRARAARQRLLRECEDPLDFAVQVVRRYAGGGEAGS
jgi:predicted glycosyltransferase